VARSEDHAMKRTPFTLPAIVISVLLGTVAAAAAQAEGHRVPPAPAAHFDGRYHHDHYYPARGSVTAVLPGGSVSIAFGNGHYFFHWGVWYSPYGPRYRVIVPPIGIVVPLLPPAYATLWIGGAPYYYANGLYYAPAARRRHGHASAACAATQAGTRPDHLPARRPEPRADRGRSPSLQPLGDNPAERDGRRERVPACDGGLPRRARLHGALSGAGPVRRRPIQPATTLLRPCCLAW
jgi:hypothetical protein